MRTERQIEASRANGAKSRGPVTPEGRRNSCGNALKHGLFADTIVLKGELEERFLELLADFERAKLLWNIGLPGAIIGQHSG